MANKRRTAGDGSVYQRSSDGKWCGAIDAGYQAGGKRLRRVVYGKTKREVLGKLKELVRDRELGIRIGERQTLAQVVTSWLEVVRTTKQPATYRTYGTVARTHILPVLGHIQVARLTGQDVQTLIGARLAAGVAPGTVRYAVTVLRAVLKQAKTWGLVARNVADAAALPRATTRAPVALTPAAVGRLLDAARGDPWEALYHLAIATGLRQGEILGLRWQDIDWEQQVLHVTGQATVDGVHVAPKSQSGVRDVTFGPELRAVLRDHQDRQRDARMLAGSAWQDHDLVFANSRGRQRAVTTVREDFYALVARAGLPRMHFHDLRHTYASLLEAAGTTPRTMQALLGHASPHMSLAYVHPYDPAKTAAAAAVERMVAHG